MKKRYLVLTTLLALSLAACSQEKAKNEDGHRHFLAVRYSFSQQQRP